MPVPYNKTGFFILKIVLKIHEHIQAWYNREAEGKEHSILFRVSVLLTITISLICGIYTTYVPEEATSIFVPIWFLTCVGYWVSYKRRNLRNWWLKLLIALFMLVVFADYLRNVTQNPFDPRIPLTGLLAWLQVLHSFDLPRKRDLNYSLLVSIILIAVSASMSRDSFFVIFLVFYTFSALGSLIFGHLSINNFLSPSSLLTGMKEEEEGWKGTLKKIIKLIFPVYVFILILSIITFLLLPRFEGLWMKNLLPFSFKIPTLPNFLGEIRNPSYPTPSRGIEGGSIKGIKRKFDPNAYYGFSTYLDLNYRGKLSDKVVLRVRSSEPAYWRGMAFDKYTGQEWTMTYPLHVIRYYTTFPPIRLYLTKNLRKIIAARHELIQTFYIEADQSNLVFAAVYPEELYFPADFVMVDKYNGIRSPIELTKGVAYTIVSRVPVFNEKSLRNNPKKVIIKAPEMYYQLHTTKRVIELAKSITKNKINDYDKIKALVDYLQTNYPYNLDIPEFPSYVDTVDYFLFEQKAGYCEHFASALAIMVRALNIPSRMVTGYRTGTYNPFTGYYEVKSSDAHGWVEIYFPHYDWIPFDPTPGSVVPWAQEKSIYYQDAFLATLIKKIPLPIRQFFNTIGAGLKNIMIIFLKINWILVAICVISLLGLFFLYNMLKKKKASDSLYGKSKIKLQAERLKIINNVKRLQSFFNKKGYVIKPADTIKEFFAPIKQKSPNIKSNIDIITDYYYKARYSNMSIKENDVNEVSNNIELITNKINE